MAITDGVYTVTQINNYIKALFARDHVLKYVSVCGEISNCKYHSSGHIYFSVKDETGQLACVMFKGKRMGLGFRLEDGQNVIISGEISVFERDGRYQLYADRIEMQGKGRLYEQFEALKAKLAAEGLFDPAHKKPIPSHIKTLGIITARTGAALQDILNITARRNPCVKPVLYPAKVQGEGSAATLIAGLKAMERISPDVIIIGRGGGSMEDLFEFNNEELARAIYDCPIPVISAVGHEIDFTIADFVADLRAPTPSAAAELAVYELAAFDAALVDRHSALCDAMLRRIRQARSDTERYLIRLGAVSPRNRLNNLRLRSDSVYDSLSRTIHNRLKDSRNELRVLSERMRAVSPLIRLEQGYSYVTDEGGHNLNSVAAVSPGDRISIRMTDGMLKAEILSKEEKTLG